MSFWKYLGPCSLQRKLSRTLSPHNGWKLSRTMSMHHEHKCKNELLKYLLLKIEATGPITVAEYMREVLTNPLSGYYMHHDVLGSSGDFITAPEVSQMFGELIAIWFLNEWSKLGKPKPLQLVEMGPGKGTLIDDILKVFSKLTDCNEFLSVHLVEVSPFLCQIQKKKLCSVDQRTGTDITLSSNFDKEFFGNQLTTKYNIPVMWHHDLRSVPGGFTFLLAHEFFDALPIHKIQKTEDGWKEVLIGHKGGLEEGCLHFVLARGPTPVSEIFIDSNEKRDHVEINLESKILIEHLTTRMKEDGGISLIIDYGHEGTKGDTFRSFRKHKHHDPLIDPGTADLTADVDFSCLKKFAKDKAVVFGPTNQTTFLKNMGIDFRLKMLLQNASPGQQEFHKSGYDFLTNPEKMGHRFKFLALFPLVLKEFLEKYPPAGFI